MDWYETVFEVIDMRSFSNIWYWIALAVLWSSVSHWVLGVPFDMIVRARRNPDTDAMQDLNDLVRVNKNRILYIAETAGSWIMVFGSATMTVLVLMSFMYDVEFAQATFLLVAPMCILALLSLGTARVIDAADLQGEALIKRLMRHRFITQLLGVISIFITAMFGMFKNLYVVPGVF